MQPQRLIRLQGRRGLQLPGQRGRRVGVTHADLAQGEGARHLHRVHAALHAGAVQGHHPRVGARQVARRDHRAGGGAQAGDGAGVERGQRAAVVGGEQQDDEGELPLDGGVDLGADHALARHHRAQGGELDAARLGAHARLHRGLAAAEARKGIVQLEMQDTGREEEYRQQDRCGKAQHHDAAQRRDQEQDARCGKRDRLDHADPWRPHCVARFRRHRATTGSLVGAVQ